MKDEVFQGLKACIQADHFNCPFDRKDGKDDGMCINDLIVAANTLLEEYDHALRMMVYQYCTMGHGDEVTFFNRMMSAGETAFNVLGIENGQPVPNDWVWKYTS